jgi:threonine dehydrogenase-like Zn-dependent dehydrogenase
VLIIGAGPTGLLLAQLLKLNGASKVVIAANKGIKTQIAKDLDAGDVYIELDRNNPEGQWQQLKQDYPYGFDVVVRWLSKYTNPYLQLNFCRLRQQVRKRSLMRALIMFAEAVL